mmetsp:Transcript_51245/g.158775  ORF Transcript_51245/g.158775 Transcript_51245/m.158775 type:complete len:306 (-) Transcript_51245:185-1102(-)
MPRKVGPIASPRPMKMTTAFFMAGSAFFRTAFITAVDRLLSSSAEMQKPSPAMASAWAGTEAPRGISATICGTERKRPVAGSRYCLKSRNGAPQMLTCVDDSGGTSGNSQRSPSGESAQASKRIWKDRSSSHEPPFTASPPVEVGRTDHCPSAEGAASQAKTTSGASVDPAAAASGCRACKAWSTAKSISLKLILGLANSTPKSRGLPPRSTAAETVPYRRRCCTAKNTAILAASRPRAAPAWAQTAAILSDSTLMSAASALPLPPFASRPSSRSVLTPVLLVFFFDFVDAGLALFAFLASLARP